MTSHVKLLVQNSPPQKFVNINKGLLCFWICMFVIGCGEAPVKVGVANWQPKCASGTIEIRPLPPAHLIQLDYQDWLKKETTAVVRVYEAVLQYKYRQSDYVVNIDKGDTPLGSQYFTAATFTYSDSAFGQYQMEWSRRGKHCPDFLKVDDRPRVFWFQLIDASYGLKCPRLSIVAIQDVEADHVLIANPVGTSCRRSYIQSAQKQVELDLNPEIQRVAEQTINETVGSFHAAGGLVLVQDVKTGRILAMASSTNGQYSGVNTVFEPGTLFKPMILAAAMNERLVTPCATTNSGVNIFEYGNKTLQCHVPTEVEGSIKYTLALSNSEVFHKIGLMLGDKRIEEYCRRFNFGSKLNCGLPSECEGFIDVDRDRNKRIASRISIGYGVGVTALQMLNAYSCIANDGTLIRPGFGQCYVPKNLGRPITQETARTMKDMLRITEEVQGKEMFESLHGLPAAGQVGMAQKKNNGYYSSDEYYVTFAGFVPVDNPVFCVFVLVDAPKPLRTGGIVAFPAFAKISIATARVLSVSKLSINSNRKEKIKEGPN